MRNDIKIPDFILKALWQNPLVFLIHLIIHIPGNKNSLKAIIS